MYLGDVSSDIVWYKQTPYQGGIYYRAGSSSELLSALNSATIDMKANYASRELFNDASAYITNNEHDELISIGIQYSVINDTNNPIMIFKIMKSSSFQFFKIHLISSICLMQVMDYQ